MKPFLACLAFTFCFSLNSYAQTTPSVTPQQWNASWISVPGINPTGYGVYLFQKTLDFRTKPSEFIIHISADNRYRLYLNGKIVSAGPARGDNYYWNYETVDIGPKLDN